MTPVNIEDVKKDVEIIKMNSILNTTIDHRIGLYSKNIGHVWLLSLLAAGSVGLTGVLPILFIPFIKNKKTHSTLRLALSFAVGGLLGEVFLHLLPRTWSSYHPNNLELGTWVLLGISTFIIIEMFFSLNENENVEVSGYLSVLANSVDNFTHGLAIGTSFVTGIKFGIITTIAIFVHEIPHEFGDFAILMKSGFSKRKAIQAQIITATIAIFGAIVALCADSYDALSLKTAWILPFSAGSFLYISLSNILPNLLKEENPKESLKHLIGITIGILLMALVNEIEDVTMLISLN